MADGNTPEHEKFHDNFATITTAIKDHLPEIATELKGDGLITGDNLDDATNISINKRKRASDLTQILEDKIKVDKSDFKKIGDTFAKTEALKSNKNILDIFKLNRDARQPDSATIVHELHNS